MKWLGRLRNGRAKASREMMTSALALSLRSDGPSFAGLPTSAIGVETGDSAIGRDEQDLEIPFLGNKHPFEAFPDLWRQVLPHPGVAT